MGPGSLRYPSLTGLPVWKGIPGPWFSLPLAFGRKGTDHLPSVFFVCLFVCRPPHRYLLQPVEHAYECVYVFDCLCVSRPTLTLPRCWKRIRMERSSRVAWKRSARGHSRYGPWTCKVIRVGWVFLFVGLFGDLVGQILVGWFTFRTWVLQSHCTRKLQYPKRRFSSFNSIKCLLKWEPPERTFACLKVKFRRCRRWNQPQNYVDF